MPLGIRPYDAMTPGRNGVSTALATTYSAIANDPLTGHRRLLRPEPTPRIAKMAPNSHSAQPPIRTQNTPVIRRECADAGALSMFTCVSAW